MASFSWLCGSPHCKEVYIYLLVEQQEALEPAQELVQDLELESDQVGLELDLDMEELALDQEQVEGAMVVMDQEELDREELEREELDQEELDREELDREELDREVSGLTPSAKAVVDWESYLEVLGPVESLQKQEAATEVVEEWLEGSDQDRELAV
ncbi:otolith matrix protein OMM-64-like [Etheostoma cragini]|uniref:otolith matrix protein OMM-64-like n=1 Tax=Etheostoma cragini TaxID=417921 RepID=UPI00155E117A|nr:otolith matrix protein OMM-64-like [Etheostoma cragini]